MKWTRSSKIITAIALSANLLYGVTLGFMLSGSWLAAVINLISLLVVTVSYERLGMIRMAAKSATVMANLITGMCLHLEKLGHPSTNHELLETAISMIEGKYATQD